MEANKASVWIACVKRNPLCLHCVCRRLLFCDNVVAEEKSLVVSCNLSFFKFSCLLLTRARSFPQ
uniref:Uncharacterized protein n=1 Tax=Setaria italica TaxID=4555 RepID=K3ZBK8_SETIT